jgi:hypothetical protein
MTRESQKAEEIRLVEQMRRALGGEPCGDLRPGNDDNEPDVLIVSNDRTVGIEVIEIHQRPVTGGPQRSQEGERLAIIAGARALAEQRAMPIASVSVHFNEHVRLHMRGRDEIIQRLLELVSSHAPEIGGTAEIGAWQLDDPLPCVHTLRITRSVLLTHHHWWAPTSGWVHTGDFTAELQAAIDDKNLRFNGYSRTCDECWLLVWASGGRPSGLFELTALTREHVYRSSFARTFFMEQFTGSLCQLTTSRP